MTNEAMGEVNQIRKTCFTIPFFSSVNPFFAEPTPKIAIVVDCVRGTGNPKREAIMTNVPLVKDTTLPCNNVRSVIFLALVSRTRPPKAMAPSATNKAPQRSPLFRPISPAPTRGPMALATLFIPT